MTSEGNYYVPKQSKWPIIASLGLFFTLLGAGMVINGDAAHNTPIMAYIIMGVGILTLVYMTFGWFGNVIHESHSGLYSAQMDRSFRWGMGWFIFSEVMFFAAFFGTLFYIRALVVPWLGGEGARGILSGMLWPEFEHGWPLLINPDNEMYQGPRDIVDPWHLPLLNTILLVTSSVTLTIAHHALRKGYHYLVSWWLLLTVVLGCAFLFFQIEEYMHAYEKLGLTLGSGIYGATFFVLTGLHGVHVTLGTLILMIMWIRVLKKHFSPNHHFAFEAASWYWHFVDVVWIGLFLCVYVL